MSFHAVQIQENIAAPAAGVWFQSPRNKRSFQAILQAPTAVQVDCVVVIEGSNDGVNAASTVLGTITLTDANGGPVSDGFTTDSAWLYFRSRVVSISGAGAIVKTLMGE